jgi:pimeloyl-ACP methyl ester carboxylesterase
MGARAFPARGVRRGTLVLVPPWKIRRPRLVAGWTRLLASAGWDVWLVSPPHHLERTAAGARSGEGFVTLDVPRLRATFEQLVLELRVFLALAARRGPVGLVGLSLGALAAALAATAPGRLDLVALVAPPDLSLVALRTGIGRRYRRLAAEAGAPWPSDGDLAAALAPLDAAARVPATRDVLVAVGGFDRIAPPEGALRLAARWGVPARVYPRGHLGLLFLCRAVRRDVAAFARGRYATPSRAVGGVRVLAR